MTGSFFSMTPELGEDSGITDNATAISVLSALEGLKAPLPIFAPYVLPLSVVVLLGVFGLQPQGSARIGKLFGPIMTLWFVTIGVLGLAGLLLAVDEGIELNILGLNIGVDAAVPALKLPARFPMNPAPAVAGEIIQPNSERSRDGRIALTN